MAAPAAALAAPLIRKIAATGVVGLMGSGMVVAMVLTGGMLSVPRVSTGLASVTCPLLPGASDNALQLDGNQIRNAQIIISSGQQMGIPTRGQVVAIATALQESTLQNLNHGDRDSLGLFQQRPSQGWGTPAQIMDPAYSSRSFYRHLQAVAGWQQMSITAAAQAVQHSGFPDAYAQHEQHAVDIVAKLAPSTAGTPTSPVTATGAPSAAPVDTSGCTPVTDMPAGPTGVMLQTALAQVGKPYVWGATGPDSFDCSGLIVYSWHKAGFDVSVRVSQEMYNIATPIPAGKEQPGDLIFTGWGEQGPGPGHVMIVVKAGTLVEAPRTGLDVRVRPYASTGGDYKYGRLPTSALHSTA
ncbi:C40 family peptidase [Streptomyces sp. H10-C2]|uniref:C40 family peptidase n=1 Tax=unclassified Streptomyces TaxID=2593676 RepID=UPI0024B93FFF|nr:MULTISPECIES: C40 family peptidase [unclassified Streptomyces]MDJ0345900.1 C40 family peptidase [Streptomyces sp. PH10-H1]MDJ0374749.1 C40 family peptidase [Streptomyces sp. H10-C2]